MTGQLRMSSAPLMKTKVLLEIKTSSLLGKEGMTVKSGKEQKGIGGQENGVEEGRWRAEGILRTLGESAGAHR